MLMCLFNSVIKTLWTNQTIQLILKLLHGISTVSVLIESFLLHETCFILYKPDHIEVKFMLFNHVLLQPIDDKDLVNFETNELDEDHLENLRHV